MPAKKKRKKGLVIAIDGPAGGGKSTSAKGLAKKLGYQYIDTGALYRCVALLSRRRGILPPHFRQGSREDRALQAGKLDDSLQEILEQLGAPDAIAFGWKGETHQVFLLGEDVSEAIREEANSQAASSVSGRPIVRDALLSFQRDLGRDGGAVLEGRDIGTVVFPDAELKVFLFANPKERARRRFEEQKARGKKVILKDILEAMEERDRQDQNRDVAPLRAAPDARELDTTDLTLDEVLATLCQWVKQV
jgi:cytidylate kinase